MGALSEQRGTSRTTHQDDITYTIFNSSDMALGSTGTLPALYLLSLLKTTFCSCKCQGLGRKESSQHLPFQAAMSQARGARCKAISTQTLMPLQGTDHACKEAAGRTARTCCPVSHQPSAKPQPDQTCKDDFALYTKGWQLVRFWTEKTGLHCYVAIVFCIYMWVCIFLHVCFFFFREENKYFDNWTRRLGKIIVFTHASLEYFMTSINK